LIWEGKGFSFDCSNKSLVMGILNVTPDSFSDGGKFDSPDQAVRFGIEMVAKGADVLDVGGESTRPGSDPVGAQEEIDRVVPVIEALAKQTGVPISVDTTKSKVADAACSAGATIINDISGLHFDSKMTEVAARHDSGLVIMHIKGEPKTMQKSPKYENLFSEIILYLKEGMDKAGEAGIDRNRIVLDPGIGFGKTLEQNIEIIANLERFAIMRRPLLLGVSRKSFIGMVTGANVEERCYGTAAAVSSCIIKGARILRVHDVEPMVQVVKVTDAITQAIRS
jgi:dihydropteroate synthase